MFLKTLFIIKLLAQINIFKYIFMHKKKVVINFYLLVQVGGEFKERDPSARHSVVMLSLVSYPVKQL